MSFSSEEWVEGVEQISEQTTTFKPNKTSPLTPNEKTLLLALVKSQELAIRDKNTDFETIQRKKIAWELIAEQFCAQPETTIARSAQQLKKCWENSRRPTKKKGDRGGTIQKLVNTDESNLMPSIVEFDFQEVTQVPAPDYPEEIEFIPQKDPLSNTDDPGRSRRFRLSAPYRTKRRFEIRPSATDMEYEEHMARMKTISLQQEHQMLEIRIAKRKLELIEVDYSVKLSAMRRNPDPNLPNL